MTRQGRRMATGGIIEVGGMGGALGWGRRQDLSTSRVFTSFVPASSHNSACALSAIGELVDSSDETGFSSAAAELFACLSTRIRLRIVVNCSTARRTSASWTQCVGASPPICRITWRSCTAGLLSRAATGRMAVRISDDRLGVLARGWRPRPGGLCPGRRRPGAGKASWQIAKESSCDATMTRLGRLGDARPAAEGPENLLDASGIQTGDRRAPPRPARLHPPRPSRRGRHAAVAAWRRRRVPRPTRCPARAATANI